MPLEGGLPTRRTFGADGVVVSGWTPDGRVLYATQTFGSALGCIFGGAMTAWTVLPLAAAFVIFTLRGDV